MNFVEFPKMARWSRDIIVTEKIDGTNGQIVIELHDESQWAGDPPLATVDYNDVTYDIWAGSKNRWIYPGGSRDNMGFAQYVSQNADQLAAVLGTGRHYGEWWGPGIQRGYGLKDKQFSLFNVTRWSYLPVQGGLVNKVPILYTGPNLPGTIPVCMEALEKHGSVASPGFMRPEGIVWWHTAGNVGFKKTFEDDEKGKGQ
jgi:RNA ligase